MKIVDEREMKENNIKKTNKDRKEQGVTEAIVKWVRAKWFCCAFKLGFFKLICNASLIFKSDLELAVSIIFKTKKIIWAKACCGAV